MKTVSVMVPQPTVASDIRIRLPFTSNRNQKPFAHLKLLTEVSPCTLGGPFSADFKGKIYAPGAVLDAEELPDPAVVLECVGPIGLAKSGKQREILWVLWRYERKLEEWIEIARAQSDNTDWSLALREPALRALHPRPELVDVTKKTVQIAERIMQVVDSEMDNEADRKVKLKVLNSVYDQVAGRIAGIAA